MNRIVRIVITIGIVLFIMVILGIVIISSFDISETTDIVVIYLFLTVCLMNAYIVYKLIPNKKRTSAQKIKLEEYNEFENIYQELSKMYKQEVELYRKPVAHKTRREIILTIIAVIGGIIGYLGLNMYIMLIGMVAGAMLIISLQTNLNIRDNYRKVYHEKVFCGLMKLLDNEFVLKNNIAQKYTIAYKLKDGKMSLATYDMQDDEYSFENNNKDKMKIFVGEGVRMTISTQNILPATVRITNDSNKTTILSQEGCTKIQMDNSEFERMFNVFSDNNIIALQLLTSDTMEMLANFINMFGNNLEVTVHEKSIDLHFYMEDSFDPGVFSNNLNKEKLLEYYILLTNMRNIIFKIYAHMKNVDD